MLKSFIKILWTFPLGACLCFCSIAIIRSIVDLPIRLDESTVVWPTLIGLGGGVVVFVFIWRFHLPYVFGHEFTHWITAKLFRRETGRLSVTRTGGSVAVSSPNIWIVLAPYFVPVYTLVWIGLYGILRFILDYPAVGLVIDMMYGKAILRLFYGGVGLTYSYHLVMTGHVLLREQKDLRQYGRFLSLSFILFCNTFLLYLALTIAASQCTYAPKLLYMNLEQQWQAVPTMMSNFGTW